MDGFYQFGCFLLNPCLPSFIGDNIFIFTWKCFNETSSTCGATNGTMENSNLKGTGSNPSASLSLTNSFYYLFFTLQPLRFYLSYCPPKAQHTYRTVMLMPPQDYLSFKIGNKSASLQVEKDEGSRIATKNNADF